MLVPVEILASELLIIGLAMVSYASALDILLSRAFNDAFGFFLNMNWASKSCIAYFRS